MPNEDSMYRRNSDGSFSQFMELSGSKVAEGIADFRLNTQGTLLASAARTATVISSTQTNYNARGVIIFLRVTAASGTGGLQVDIRALDTSSSSYLLTPISTAITASGTTAYILYPGIGGTVGADMKQLTSLMLPRTWTVRVSHGDASSYTYQVDYSLIL